MHPRNPPPYSGFVLNAVALAVGYQATTGDGKTEKLNAVLEALINVVRPTGGLGIPGLYVPSDPGAPMKVPSKLTDSEAPHQKQ